MQSVLTNGEIPNTPNHVPEIYFKIGSGRQVMSQTNRREHSTRNLNERIGGNYIYIYHYL